MKNNVTNRKRVIWMLSPVNFKQCVIQAAVGFSHLCNCVFKCRPVLIAFVRNTRQYYWIRTVTFIWVSVCEIIRNIFDHSNLFEWNREAFDHSKEIVKIVGYYNFFTKSALDFVYIVYSCKYYKDQLTLSLI